MDLLTIVATCALSFDHATLTAIIKAETQGTQDYVRMVSDAKPTASLTVMLDTHPETIARFGIAAITPAMAAKARSNLKDAATPCVNVRIAALALASLAEDCAATKAPQPLLCAIGRYKSLSSDPDLDYATRIRLAAITAAQIPAIADPTATLTLKPPTDKALKSPPTPKPPVDDDELDNSPLVPAKPSKRKDEPDAPGTTPTQFKQPN